MIKIGLFVGQLLPDAQSGILIGRDSRRSGQMLESALISGMISVISLIGPSL